jgi:hypothetical protein
MSKTSIVLLIKVPQDILLVRVEAPPKMNDQIDITLKNLLGSQQLPTVWLGKSFVVNTTDRISPSEDIDQTWIVGVSEVLPQ